MKEAATTLTSKGQITIPAAVRQHLGIVAGDKVVFVIEDDGAVRMERPHYPSVAALRGAAGSLTRPLSWGEMRAIAREEQAESVRPAER